MPDLNFTIEGAETVRFAASPHIAFRLHVSNTSGEAIHSVILQCQLQLDVTRRRYTAPEKASLVDLFGETERWGQTLRSMLWTNTHVVIPSFAEKTTIPLPIPCTFDFNVAATKYFAGLDDGEVPISFYFNGTVFYAGEHDTLQVDQISWEKEASYNLPVRVWKEMMNTYYPNMHWLCLQRDAFDRLYQYKLQHGIPTFEQTLEAIIK